MPHAGVKKEQETPSPPSSSHVTENDAQEEMMQYEAQDTMSSSTENQQETSDSDEAEEQQKNVTTSPNELHPVKGEKQQEDTIKVKRGRGRPRKEVRKTDGNDDNNNGEKADSADKKTNKKNKRKTHNKHYIIRNKKLMRLIVKIGYIKQGRLFRISKSSLALIQEFMLGFFNNFVNESLRVKDTMEIRGRKTLLPREIDVVATWMNPNVNMNNAISSAVMMPLPTNNSVAVK